MPTRVTLRTITTLAALAPGRPAQLAPVAGGAIYALHAADAGSDAIVERIDAVGAGRARRVVLAADSIIRTLHLDAKAAGQIVAVAARDDGRLAFAFLGDVAGNPFAAVGTWDPATNAVLVTVDQADLVRADARFADDLAVNRPTLLVSGDDAQLWRAGDRGIRLLAIGGLSAMRPTLDARTIDLGAGTDVGGEQRVERRAWEWTSGGDAGAVLLTDTASRWIRRLDVAAGTASHVARFDDAAAVSAIGAATLDPGGRVMTLALDRDGVARSLLVQDGPAFAAIDASRWQLDGGAAPALRIDRLTPVPGAPGNYVAFDVATGRVLGAIVE